MTTVVSAETFDIAHGDLKTALSAYAAQTGALVVSSDAVNNVQSGGVKGEMPAAVALSRILQGTGFVANRTPSGQIEILKEPKPRSEIVLPLQLAQATPARPAVETVTVTSSKLGGADVQSIPIAITALSQEQLTATQTAGGPDLIKQVPNMTFTKTNFSGYSIQLRGIGTQAISVTTDPAVAVAFNDTPFIRNHFFEQEFYDVGQVEVLRGPQGTLYGRNATAGVVNLTSARPTDQFEAMASGELGNYHQRRFEGMINIPIVDDRVDIRVAGEWTKRQGYSFNESTNKRIDGRDLWSGRVTIGWKPVEDLQAYLVWEHFSEDDDRIRSSKQLCKTAPIPDEVGGVPVAGVGNALGGGDYISQGCLPASLYSPESFQVPNGFSLPYYTALGNVGVPVKDEFDPYASTTQSQNLRVIESRNDPIYRVKNDIVELNADYRLRPALVLTSQTAFNHDFLWATQDFNRFNTAPGAFSTALIDQIRPGIISPSGVFCDPQLGCSDRLVAQDLSEEHSWQLNQEFRLTSSFSGPFNFSGGGNYMHYETEENYYVFVNTLTMYAVEAPFAAGPFQNVVGPYQPGITDNRNCLPQGFAYGDPTQDHGILQCIYIDPNPIDKLNGNGHNYFLSKNPYVLNSYALFGEANYKVADDLKLTAGLRWTEDQKHFSLIPSWLVVNNSWGYPVVKVVDQQWDQFSGRLNATWTPKLAFTDQSLFYGSYAHGYKAGGANPPGAVLLTANTFGDAQIANPIHPLTFKPEFVDAFELGTKNTLLDGAITFNASAFYYNYQNYQISEIVDRTSINLNFDAHVKGAEVEAVWEPVPGLRFNFAGGWENTSLAKGQKAVDLIDRTAGNPDWMVIKPPVTQSSNCIMPVYVVANLFSNGLGNDVDLACGAAYVKHVDPGLSIGNYPGFDPTTAPNNGEGFDKDLSGHELPNAPPYTVSAGAQYTIPLSSDWAGTLRADYYWQDYSWARVFNDNPYDRLRGYTNLNLTLIFTSQGGWQVMLYDKNVFNTTDITGTFLNSDDTGLTTNVFLTDPKVIGIRVTKNW